MTTVSTTETPDTAEAAIDLIALYEEHLRDLGRAESTINHYVWLLRRIDRTLSDGINGACTAELRDFIPVRLAKATRENYRAAMVGYFTWACAGEPEERWLDFNPALRLPQVTVPNGVPRPVETDQLADILTEAQQPFRLWFQLAAYCGARAVEIAALNREDITQRRVLLHGKGDKTRMVPTHPDVWAAVQDLPRGAITRRRDGKRSTRKDVDSRANTYLDRLGHGNVTLHQFRHWFASTTYATGGEDLMTVQELLGHSSVSTTQRYVRVASANKDRAVAGLPSLGQTG